MRYMLTMSSWAIAALLAACTNNYRCAPPCGPVVEETYVHKYGVEVSPSYWSAEGEHGKVITTLKNGVVIAKSYDAGVPDGETTYSFPHSETIEKVETYSQGNLVKKVNNYLSGAPKEEIQFLSPDQKTITMWYDSGSPQSVEHYQGDVLVQGEYYTLSHQVESRVENKEGVRTMRDQYGQLAWHDTIENGHMTTRTTYHPNGSPKEDIPYSQGLVDGQKKSFLPGGEPNTLEKWVSGKQEGTTIVFQHGDKLAEVPYINGMKEGVEKRYRDGQEVAQELSWARDRRHGPSYTYLGSSVQTEWYYQGTQVSKSQYDLLTSRPQ